MKIDCDIKLLYHLNQSTHNPWHWIFLTLYCLLTLSAFVSNSLLLVGLKCVRVSPCQKGNPLLCPINLLLRQPKPSELTRDMLIAYLAIFDLFLSLTIPLSALDGLSKFWPLGPSTELLCRITKASPSVAVYSSSLVIMLIAVNCYRQILYPYKKQIAPSNLKYYMFAIVASSLVNSFPLFYYTRLFQFPSSSKNVSQVNDNTTLTQSNFNNLSNVTLNDLLNSVIKDSNGTVAYGEEEEYEDDCKHLDENGWSHVMFCLEDWPFGQDHFDPSGRIYYTWLSFSIQLVIPLIVITVCYSSIYYKLKRQDILRRSLIICQDAVRQHNEDKRCKRRNRQMIIISLVYLISWFPLGIVSILLDYDPYIVGTNTARVTMLFVGCHLLGMLSASINPVIYGYKNKQVRTGNTFSMVFMN